MSPLLSGLGGFDEVWAVDYEFTAQPGERPVPICMVAWELRSDTRLVLWEDELRALDAPPYDIGPNSVTVAYYASAELGCHLALGWPLPAHVLDLFVEFRNLTNGLRLPCGAGLLGALVAFGHDAIDSVEKDSMRELALRGGPWTPRERKALTEYCESDVVGLSKLLASMLPRIDIPRALLRGRYMGAAARMEFAGVPIDLDALNVLRASWDLIKQHLIARVDVHYGVFEHGVFRRARWAEWLARSGIPWPRLPSGALALDRETFRQMARAHPEVALMGELRRSLSSMRLADLQVGADGRNRCLLSAFRARTGRNQPSNSKFIFGPSVWLRSLIRPEPGHALAYIDWSQQEFGIAGALSGDQEMRDAYSSGDPYLAFAKQAGAAPHDATKQSHGGVREMFKACALGVLYGMGAESLASRTGQSSAQARELLRIHRRIYGQFWQWSDAAVDQAMLKGRLRTAFGWTVNVGPDVNPRSLRNFPMQSNGAEMLRLACCFATEAGVEVCAPVHDALLITAPVGGMPGTVAQVQAAMVRASEAVLGGFPLRSDASVVEYPARFSDPRGTEMWTTVWDIVAEQEPARECSVPCAPVRPRPI